MKVLVTGANGYIGNHVVEELLNNSHHVIAIDLRNNNIDNRVEYIDCDIFSGEEDLYHKLEQPDICIHLAWQDGFVHNSDKHIKNLYKHFKFIKNLINNGINRVVVMGTMHEVGYYEGCVDENTPCNPISMYGIAKNALRQMLFTEFGEGTDKIQWLRAYYIIGDDARNNSIFSKIRIAESKGQEYFPFTTGENKYDFINIEELSKQIVACASQNKVNGIINCCSGEPIALKDKVEGFISDNGFKIKLQYGVFPDRKYDSPAIWGDCSKINSIMDKC